MNRLVAAAILAWALSFGTAPAQDVAAASFTFKKTGAATYLLAKPEADRLAATNRSARIALRSTKSGTNEIQSTSRLVLKTISAGSPLSLLAGRPLTLDQTIAPDLFVLQAPDAWAALEQAAQLSTNPAVAACYPVTVRRRSLASIGQYAPAPNDPFFSGQWHLENRAATGAPLSAGPDINARSAWSITTGQGIVIAIGDTGVQYTNSPDLAANNVASLNLDFSTVSPGNYASGSTNAGPNSASDSHATCVAGLAVATQNNGIGISGVAPGALYASWKMFTQGAYNITSEQEMMMYQYRSNIVAVQNHSWGDIPVLEEPLDALESAGLQNAITYGRGGKGSIIVRVAGNDRMSGRDAQADGNDANDDPYANDVHEIAVAAVGIDGTVASYSSPGACILVAAPGGDFAYWNRGWPWQTQNIGLYTTDYSFLTYPGDPNNQNYYVASTVPGPFIGTSGATPIIAGVAALALSVNTNLGYRDVQQLLALSARHYDLADPAVQTNGAGLRVSGNVGYGVPDAGLAVRLAQTWSNRPATISVTKSTSAQAAIPLDGLRLSIPGAPAALTSLHGSPSLGATADQPTPSVPLVNLGAVTGPITQNLAGKAAVIQQSASIGYYQSIDWAAQAGASFAVIYGSSPRAPMLQTDLTPIPALLLAPTDGQALANYLQTNTAPVSGRVLTLATNINFAITNTLVCEHIHVTVTTTCTNRSGMRIVVTSPSGAVSVLQHINRDTSAGPNGWTYTSTQHFFESSAGTWQIAFSYQQPGGAGTVTGVSLVIDGVPIVDTDHDGLDDRWERAWFGNLNQTATASPAGDDWPNSVKQILGVNPNLPLFPFNLDMSFWNDQWVRLAWPGVDGSNYDLLNYGNPATPVPGLFPETETFVPIGNTGLFRVRQP